MMNQTMAPAVVETPAPWLVEVEITTFGVLHGKPPEPRHPQSLIRIDLRHALRNPFDDLAMRELTGLDEVVRGHVMGTEGADEILRDALGMVLAQRAAGPTAGLIEVYSYCKGGRHRSVAMALALQSALAELGIGAEVVHLDIAKPVVGKGEVPAGFRG